MDRLEIAIGHQLGDLTIDLELGVDPGQTVALLGPSGAGKSSVLRVIAGLLEPSQGHIRLGADRWFDAAEGINLSPEERSVGLVFQDYALFPHMTVLENVAFADRDAAPQMLRRFGVGELGGAMPSRLSGGERQRVALARALARDPDVLLLDEPLSALDTITRREVRAELSGLLAEVPVPTIVVTHDPADAAELADNVAVMDGGKIVQLGTLSELRESPQHITVERILGPAESDER
jgi:molybdate transport system ATP-binding protein